VEIYFNFVTNIWKIVCLSYKVVSAVNNLGLPGKVRSSTELSAKAVRLYKAEARLSGHYVS